MIKIFNHYFPRRTLLQIFLDFGLVIVTVVAAVMWRVPDLVSGISVAVTSACLLATGMVAINSALGLYERVHSRSIMQSRARGALSLLLTLGLAYAILGVLPLRRVDLEFLAVTISAGIFIVLFHRISVAHSTPQSKLRTRVLVFGTGMRAKLVSKSLKRSDPNVDLVGFYAGPNEVKTEVSGWGLLSTTKPLTDLVAELQVDEIVVALTERRGGSMPLRELLDCKLHGVRVVDIATHFEQTLGQIRLDSVSAGWLIFGDGFNQGIVRTMMKRLFDIVFATLLILVTSPIILITAILIVLESGGPILYLQERVGRGGRLFNVVKFRSMRTDAERDGKPRWATAKDDRVTNVGRVIRKLRIDELPQLFSVLNGDMSLVGPRPERPYFVDKLTQEIPYYAVRHSVKPGVTGWAQVRFHYGASVEDSAEKLQYDLYYVKNHTLFLDLVVLFETIGVVLMAKGAH
jgi:sugar transferase (PEP-CTERM system associated)